MEYSLMKTLSQPLLTPPIKFTHRPSRSSTVFTIRAAAAAAAPQPPPLKDDPADKAAAVAAQAPPSQDDPALALKKTPAIIQIIDDFNKTYGPLGKFNKLLESFKFYSPVIGPIFGALNLMWDWTKKKDANFQRLKMFASKYGAYLAIIAVIVAVATIMWPKKNPDRKEAHNQTPEMMK